MIIRVIRFGFSRSLCYGMGSCIMGLGLKIGVGIDCVLSEEVRRSFLGVRELGLRENMIDDVGFKTYFK